MLRRQRRARGGSQRRTGAVYPAAVQDAVAQLGARRVQGCLLFQRHARGACTAARAATAAEFGSNKPELSSIQDGQPLAQKGRTRPFSGAPGTCGAAAMVSAQVRVATRRVCALAATQSLLRADAERALASLLLPRRCRRRLRTSAATRSSTAAAARARPTTGAAAAAAAALVSGAARSRRLLPNRARLRLTIQDKNKYNSPKYRLVVRFVRARPPRRRGSAMCAGHTLGFRPRAPLPRRRRAAPRRFAAARRTRRR